MFLKMHETFALFKDMHTDETFSGWVCGVSSLTACVQDKFCYTILDEKTATSNSEHKYIHTVM